MKEKIKKIVQFIANPRLLLCILIAWLITNGWSYIMFGFGTFCKIGWMIAVSGTYLAFLWLPFTPEKLITVALAMLFLKWFFPKDEKTLGILKNMHSNFKIKRKEKKAKKEEQKEKKQIND